MRPVRSEEKREQAGVRNHLVPRHSWLVVAFLSLTQVLKELFVLEAASQHCVVISFTPLRHRHMDLMSPRPRRTFQPFAVAMATTPNPLGKLLGN